jgi:hypothetical protein
MKYLFILVTAFILLFTSCASQVGENQMDEKAETAQVLDILKHQQDSWNNGDVDGFMNGYWKHDSLMFVSGEKVLYGWQHFVTLKRQGH